MRSHLRESSYTWTWIQFSPRLEMRKSLSPKNLLQVSLWHCLGMILIWGYQQSCFCSEGGTGEGGWEGFKVSQQGIRWWKRHDNFQRTEQKQRLGCHGVFWISPLSNWQFQIHQLARAFWGNLSNSRPGPSTYNEQTLRARVIWSLWNLGRLSRAWFRVVLSGAESNRH